jgi:2-C-methyl-D-erythritol 4-phosphate cytidylyltransferase
MRTEKIGAIVAAAGQSQRMNGLDKAFADLGGKPLLAWVLGTLQQCNAVDEIVVVLSRDNLERGKKLQNESGWSKVAALCVGGARRQDSVKEGLTRLTDCQWVVIHDGARPFLTPELVERGLDEARLSGAAIAAVPVKDTVKVATPDGFVRDTPRRDNLWAVQTPQVFRFDLINQAHDQITDDVSDDATMVERLGHRVKLYMGSYKNIKITTPDDLALAELILRNR